MYTVAALYSRPVATARRRVRDVGEWARTVAPRVPRPRVVCGNFPLRALNARPLPPRLNRQLRKTCPRHDVTAAVKSPLLSRLAETWSTSSLTSSTVAGRSRQKASDFACRHRRSLPASAPVAGSRQLSNTSHFQGSTQNLAVLPSSSSVLRGYCRGDDPRGA